MPNPFPIGTIPLVGETEEEFIARRKAYFFTGGPETPERTAILDTKLPRIYNKFVQFAGAQVGDIIEFDGEQWEVIDVD